MLRHLAELLDADVERAYAAAGIDFRPRYTPVIRLLSEQGPSTIRAISNFGGITHSAASQTVAEMVKRGLVRSEPSVEDARERLISLTPEGDRLLAPLRAQWAATNAAAAHLEQEIGLPLHDALARAIDAIDRRPFRDRIAAKRPDPS